MKVLALHRKRKTEADAFFDVKVIPGNRTASFHPPQKDRSKQQLHDKMKEGFTPRQIAYCRARVNCCPHPQYQNIITFTWPTAANLADSNITITKKLNCAYVTQN